MLNTSAAKRRFVALAAPLLVAGLAVSTSSPANAYAGGSCSISVPSRVAVKAPYQRVVGKLASNCAASGADFAAWDIYHPRYGLDSLFIMDGTSSDNWDFYDFDHLGVYTVEPESAFDTDFNELSQNSAKIDVRLNSKYTFSTSRSGKYVTLKSTVYRYSPSAGHHKAWKGATVRYYYRTSSSRPWTHLKTHTTNSDGKASYKFKASSKRYYQERVADTSTTWGSTSGSHRR